MGGEPLLDPRRRHRLALGLDAREGEVRLDSLVPDEIGCIFVSRLQAVGTHRDEEATGTKGHVRLAR